MLNSSFFKITINSLEFLVNSNLSVLEACKYSGFHVPRFCYHEFLSVSGNCRMCLVELSNSPKPIASCVFPLTNNMSIFLDTPLVLKARENILEALLLHHPLDCPICDQAGECDLQDQAVKFGVDTSRYYFYKRSVEDKYFSPIITTIMTRCIHCTRCVRYSSEILGLESLGALNRGGNTEIGNYTTLKILSEISGNVIDLCPVGALTSKSYAFKARPWELRILESIDLTDSLGANTYIHFKDLTITRVVPKINFDLNGSLISDNARYFFESLESQRLLKIYSTFSLKNNLTSIKLFKTIKNEIFRHLNNGTKFLFLIDDHLDLESIQLSKFLSYTYNLKVKCLKPSIINSNIYFTNSFSKVIDLQKKIQFFFLISTSLKIESAIINSKIRIKYLKEDIQIYNLLGNYKLNYAAQFININLNFFLTILEGKKLNISSFIIQAPDSFFIIGESFYKRGLNSYLIFLFLKKLVPSSNFLNIRAANNSEGLDYSFIPMVSKKDFKTSTQLVCINLFETLQLYKQLKSYKNTIVWYNTHGAFYCSKVVTHMLPLLPYFYSNSLYINLEKRVQQVLQLFPLESSNLSLIKLETKTELLSFLSQKLVVNRLINIQYSLKYKYLTFFFDIVAKPTLFYEIFSFLNIKLINNYYLNKNLVSFYPVKNSIEDFYLNNKFTKYSKLLAQCSYETRELVSNF
jgi:NADH-quinone oxidoreductase subunit G